MWPIIRSNWIRQSLFYLKRISILLYLREVAALGVVWIQNTGLSPETDLDVIIIWAPGGCWWILWFSIKFLNAKTQVSVSSQQWIVRHILISCFYNKRIVNIACCLVTVTEKAIACFNVIILKDGGGGKQKITDFVLSESGSWAALSCCQLGTSGSLSDHAIRKSFTLFLASCCLSSWPPCPTCLSTTNTPSWLSIREKPE